MDKFEASLHIFMAIPYHPEEQIRISVQSIELKRSRTLRFPRIIKSVSEFFKSHKISKRCFIPATFFTTYFIINNGSNEDQI